jgi:hypothetical protein
MAFGMDEIYGGVPEKRYIAGTEGEWQLRMQVRSSSLGQSKSAISAEDVLKQAEMALWLLSHYGSIGSRGRKGFGSIQIEGESSIGTLDDAKLAASSLRIKLELNNNYNTTLLESSSFLHTSTITGTVNISAPTGETAIETVGAAYAFVSASYKHNEAKASLGLPRKLHGPKPYDELLPHQTVYSYQRPIFLGKAGRNQDSAMNARYSSPIHLHLQRIGSNSWQVNWVAFPSVDLPTLDQSASFLTDFCNAFDSKLTSARSVLSPEQPNYSTPSQTVQGFVRTTVTILAIIEVATKQHYKVQEEGNPKTGMLVNGVAPKTPPTIGDQVNVYRSTTSDPNSPSYRWDPPTQKANFNPNNRTGRR